MPRQAAMYLLKVRFTQVYGKTSFRVERQNSTRDPKMSIGKARAEKDTKQQANRKKIPSLKAL